MKFKNQNSKLMNKFQRLTQIEYKEKLEKTLFKTFFHNPEWHDFLEKEFKWLKFEYYLYGSNRRDGKDEAILPFARFRVLGKEKLVSLPFCEYGGPLPLRNEISFDEFFIDAISGFGKNIKIRFHPGLLDYFIVPDPAPFISNMTTNWIKDLITVDEKQLLASFRKTLRYEIRDARQKNILIKKCENAKELKQFYGLYFANLKRRKTVPYPFSIFEFLYHNPNAEIILAALNGKIVGGNLFLNYGKFTHYFFSAFDYYYRDFGISYLLVWDKIKNLIGQDKILDLGASPKDSSLDIFKRGWGGTEYPILQLGIKRSEESLRLSKLRNIWSLLPDFVVKKLSPRLIKYRL